MQTGKEQRYQTLLQDLDTVLEGERDPLVWMSTVACLLRERLEFFWVGFYRVQGRELVIGPYQGSLACLRIPFERGVCGACARQQRTLVVPDVHEFPDHIACDARSRSEIVVPVFDQEGSLRAVLDADSDRPAFFDETDRLFLERIAGRMRVLQWNGGS